MVVPDRGLRRKAYSAHYDYGMDATQIHRELLPLCTVERLLREFKLTFSWERIGRQKKGRTKLSPRGLAALGTMLQEDPTLYLKQLKTRLRSEYGVRVSQSTICRAINTPVHRGGLGMSLKTLEHRAMQRNQVDRLAWTERLNLGDFDHSNVLVIDECSVGKNAARRRRGYGDVGHRVRWYDSLAPEPQFPRKIPCWLSLGRLASVTRLLPALGIAVLGVVTAEVLAVGLVLVHQDDLPIYSRLRHLPGHLNQLAPIIAYIRQLLFSLLLSQRLQHELAQLSWFDFLESLLRRSSEFFEAILEFVTSFFHLVASCLRRHLGKTSHVSVLTSALSPGP